MPEDISVNEALAWLVKNPEALRRYVAYHSLGHLAYCHTVRDDKLQMARELRPNKKSNYLTLVAERFAQ